MPPPIPLLVLAAASAVAALLLIPFDSERLHLVGWACGSLLSIGLLTTYTAIDAKRGQSTRYAGFPAAARTRTIVAAGALVAASAHAFAFATKVAG
jgi:hypothetical protein